MTDKERDDALIAETNKNWQAAGVPLPYLDWFAREILRLERSGWKPKPDRAEALAWMIEGLFAEAADNPCTCASDENSCPHCNAWERATKQTRACIVEAIDELRAEWEAERPAVVVPDSIRMTLGWINIDDVSRHVTQHGWDELRDWFKKQLIDGAKGGE